MLYSPGLQTGSCGIRQKAPGHVMSGIIPASRSHVCVHVWMLLEPKHSWKQFLLGGGVIFQTDFLSLDSVFSTNTFISITLFSVTMSHSEPGQQPADTRSVSMARNHPKIKVPRVAESTCAPRCRPWGELWLTHKHLTDKKSRATMTSEAARH